MDGIFNIHPSTRSPSQRRPESPCQDSFFPIRSKIRHHTALNSVGIIDYQGVPQSIRQYYQQHPARSPSRKRPHTPIKDSSLGIGSKMSCKASGDTGKPQTITRLRNGENKDALSQVKIGHACENAYEFGMGDHTEMPRGCHMNPDFSRDIDHFIFVCEEKGLAIAEVWQLKDMFQVQRRPSSGAPKRFINSIFGEDKARALAYVTACYNAHPDNRNGITADLVFCTNEFT
eukprot:Lankesteria_metandrocarpae@DN5456_c0_g1_i7.p1